MILLLLLFVPFLQAQSYHITGDRYVVDRAEEWRSWSLPKRAVVVTPEGGVHPFWVRKEIDAVRDAGEYVHRVTDDQLLQFPFARPWEEGLGRYSEMYIASGGAKNVGSNLGDAGNAVDGDSTTYWEPDAEDDLSEWWIEVDLGRAVFATKIVVRFVEPFRGFKIMTSNGPPIGWIGVAEGSRFDWKRLEVFTSSKIQEEQKLAFEVELTTPKRGGGPDAGALIQYVRVQAINRFEKGEEVTKAEYEALPPEDRGVLEYFRRTDRGGVRPTTRKVYEALPVKKRGAIRYYTRPRPRLSEMEVWSVGDNIALGLLDRGGSVDNPATKQPAELRSIVDGSYLTGKRLAAFSDTPAQLIADLGATFWVDNVRLIVTWGLLYGYRIDVSDGTRASAGDLAWTAVTPDERSNIPEGAGDTEDSFDLRKVRYLQLSFFSTLPIMVRKWTPRFSLQEMQVYGEGYAPEVTLESPVVFLGAQRALSYIHWEGDIRDGTSVQVRTRTGDRMKKIQRFFDINGEEITERQWHRLPGFLRVPPVSVRVPAEDWSDWSAPYRHPGELIRSPTPTRYVQFQIRLLSDEPDRCAVLRRLSVEYFTPLVHRVVGEIAPKHVPVGMPQTFSLFVKMKGTKDDLGVDELVLTSPYRVTLTFEGLRIGTEESLLDLSPDEFTLTPTSTDSLRIRFAGRIFPVKETLLEVRFSSTIFLKGTLFRAFLRNFSIDSPQEVRAGDATGLSDTQTMTVSVPVDPKVLGTVEVHPNPFTPNGDGINDETHLTFPVFNLDIPATIRVTLYDLRGEPLRHIEDQCFDVSGEHDVVWDGRDDAGRLVPPGMYLARISLPAKARNADHTVVHRVLYVAY